MDVSGATLVQSRRVLLANYDTLRHLPVITGFAVDTVTGNINVYVSAAAGADVNEIPRTLTDGTTTVAVSILTTFN